MRLLKLAALLTPVSAFIFLGQTSFPRQQIFAVTGLTVAIILCLVRVHKNKFLAKSRQAFIRGMILLGIVMSVCTFLPVGGTMSFPLLLEHSPNNAQAVFVLASGATPARTPGFSGLQRVTHGIKLLKEGRADKIYISTGYSPVTQHAEAEWVTNLVSLFDLPPASYSLLIIQISLPPLLKLNMRLPVLQLQIPDIYFWLQVEPISVGPVQLSPEQDSRLSGSGT